MITAQSGSDVVTEQSPTVPDSAMGKRRLDAADEGNHQLLLELRPSRVAESLEGLVHRERLAIGARSGHGGERIGDRQHVLVETWRLRPVGRAAPRRGSPPGAGGGWR